MQLEGGDRSILERKKLGKGRKPAIEKSQVTSEEKEEFNRQLLGAAKKGDFVGVQIAIGKGADVNAKSRNGKIALKQAAYSPEMTRMLKEAGATK